MISEIKKFLEKKSSLLLKLLFLVLTLSFYASTFAGIKIQPAIYFIISIFLVLLFEKSFSTINLFSKRIIKVSFAISLTLNFIIQTNLLPLIVINRVGFNDSLVIFTIFSLNILVFSRGIINLAKNHSRFLDFAKYFLFISTNLFIGIAFYTLILYFLLPRNMNLLDCKSSTNEQEFWYIDHGGIKGKFMYEYSEFNLGFLSINNLTNTTQITLNNICGE